MNEPTLGCLEAPPSAGTAVWVREQESETFARAVATGSRAEMTRIVSSLLDRARDHDSCAATCANARARFRGGHVIKRV